MILQKIIKLFFNYILLIEVYAYIYLKLHNIGLRGIMSGKEYYKTKMVEYEKARDKLASYKEELDRYLDSCRTDFKDFNTVYEASYNLQGEVMDNFNYKSEDFSKEVNQLFGKIEDDISIIDNERAN